MKGNKGNYMSYTPHYYQKIHYWILYYTNALSMPLNEALDIENSASKDRLTE